MSEKQRDSGSEQAIRVGRQLLDQAVENAKLIAFMREKFLSDDVQEIVLTGEDAQAFLDMMEGPVPEPTQALIDLFSDETPST
jgi:hypothetical protein